jgi:hypothetical protein
MAGQGTQILASDFNAIQSIIATVLGAGSGTLGYGQTVTSSQVAVGQKITAAQWIALRNDLLAARQHQTGNNESGNLTLPNTGILVKYSDWNAYYQFAQLIQTNALVQPPAGQASLATLSSSQRTTAWNGTINHTVTLNFGSNANARYYFNSGSNIQFSANLTNIPVDGSQAKGNDWATLLSNMGTITMNYNSTTNTGSGTPASSVGFYQLTTSPQTLFTKATSSPTYTPNQYDIYGQVDGTGSIVTFTISFQDLSGQPNAPWGTDENVEGTLTSTVQGYYASGSNVTVGGYTPSVTSSGP